jgi:hypothetical protein
MADALEASPRYGAFYDSEVLPKLESDIAETRERATHWPALPPPPYFRSEPTPEQVARWQQKPAEMVASLEMTRAKILRVLGRDPAAGEREAYEWMNSPDPQLRQDAVIVFADIHNHDDELRSLATDDNFFVADIAKAVLLTPKPRVMAFPVSPDGGAGWHKR